MWFADVGLMLALVVLGCVVALSLPAWLARRAGRSDRWVRRAVWVGGSIAAALLVAQAAVVDLVEDANGPPALDQPVLTWIVAHRVGWVTTLAIGLAVAGGVAAMTAVTALTVLVLLLLGRRWQAGLVVLAGAGSALLVGGFKQLYARGRPPPAEQVITYGSHALPSGHALGSTVVLGMVAAVIVLTARSRVTGVAATVTAAVLVLAVGLSRVYLAAHWFTDVLTGWLLGGAWLTAAVTALVLLKGRDGLPTQPVSARTSQTSTPSRY